MDSGGDNGDSSFEVEIWIETAKSANVIVARFRKCKKYDQRRWCIYQKIKPQLRAGGLRWDRSCVFSESCCLSPIRINSILEEFRVRRLAVIQE